MQPGDVVFRESFDPVEGETEYTECLILVLNEESGKAKVAFSSPYGYGEIKNFVPVNELTEEAEE